MYQHFIGEDCVIQFLQFVESLIEDVVLPFIDDKMNIPLDHSTVIDFELQRNCYLCKYETRYLVKDHCHVTGKYLGAACNECNLSRKVRKDFPIVFHNLRGYDVHHILKHGLSKMN